VLQIQRLLKDKPKLDKYKDASGTVRWKKAVGEALRAEVGGRFAMRDKTAGGKIVWELVEGPGGVHPGGGGAGGEGEGATEEQQARSRNM
jgi:hypothetical protein